MIAEFLEMSGCNAIPLYDGLSALQVAGAFLPNVIFCDIGMPHMDGYEVVKRMRSMLCLKETKLIALTAWNDEVSRAKVISAGFHVHLTKPAELSAILGQVPQLT